MTNFPVPDVPPGPFKTTAEGSIPLPIPDPQNSSLSKPEETKSPASTYSQYLFQENKADTPCVPSSMDRDGTTPYQPIDYHDHNSTRPKENEKNHTMPISKHDIDIESQVPHKEIKISYKKQSDFCNFIMDLVGLCCWLLIFYGIFVVWCWVAELRAQ